MLGAGAFRVRHDPLRPSSPVWRVPLVSLAGLGIAALSIWVAHGQPPWQAIVRETGDLRVDRALGRLVAFGNPFFQIESLYRFNAKFFPRWEPRYLGYEGTFGLPRAGIAALWAEGQLPKPSLARPSIPRTGATRTARAATQ